MLNFPLNSYCDVRRVTTWRYLANKSLSWKIFPLRATFIGWDLVKVVGNWLSVEHDPPPLFCYLKRQNANAALWYLLWEEDRAAGKSLNFVADNTAYVQLPWFRYDTDTYSG